MGRKPKPEALDTSRSRKMHTPTAQENYCIALAYELAEQHLRDGTATSQEIVHFLKMGSPSERKKTELVEKQILLAEKKAEAYDTSKRIEELYADAISAVQSYRSSIPKTGMVDDE